MFVVWQLFGCSVLAFSIVLMITILVLLLRILSGLFCGFVVTWEFYCVNLLFWLCLGSLRQLGCSIWVFSLVDSCFTFVLLRFCCYNQISLLTKQKKWVLT